MTRRSASRSGIAAAALLLVLTAGACVSNPNMKRADAFALDGEWDNAISYYQQRLNEDPGDQEARRKLMLARANSAAFHRAEGNKLFKARDLQRAQLELELAVRLDPTNQAAQVSLRRGQRGHCCRSGGGGAREDRHRAGQGARGGGWGGVAPSCSTGPRAR